MNNRFDKSDYFLAMLFLSMLIWLAFVSFVLMMDAKRDWEMEIRIQRLEQAR